MDGVLLRDKPAGLTSHDVVVQARRRFGVKAGHAGTLDPFATGLLLVLLGRATRLQRFLTELPKTYRAVARLGWRSDTGDPDGELVHTGLVPETLELPTGEVRQQLPMTSAARVEGERLYRRAHRGETIATPTRTVHVARADLLERRSDERAEFEIECSAGTYIRTLIETLQDAYCEELRRTRIGPFRIEDADEQEPLTLAQALPFLPERPLTEAEARRVGHGQAIPALDAGDPGPVRLTSGGELIAIAEPRGSEAKPLVVLS